MKTANTIMVGPCDTCGEASLFAAGPRNRWLPGVISRVTRRYSALGVGEIDLACCTCGSARGDDFGPFRDADGEMIAEKFSDLLVEVVSYIAAGDNVLHPAELELLRELAITLELDPDKVIDRTRDALNAPAREREYMVRKLRHARHLRDRRSNLLLLGGAIQISFADGVLQEEELQLLVEITKALGFGRGTFEIMLELAQFGAAAPLEHLKEYIVSVRSQNISRYIE